ncbi:MAG: 3-isopropylmalate dehydratase small subunit, partial [Vicinamibacteria bacterium]|nr:3-isopropylmalate dehydratase small subunit [Vicinamibacteria bacterium]
MSVSRIQRVAGRALPLRGHDIDTDRIIPARYLKSVSFEGLERYVFADDRSDPAHAFNQPQYEGAQVLLVNRNFGCGSSREHAPQALQRWGINAVVGESFSEIFFGNSVQLGLPCLTVSHDQVEQLLTAVEADPALTVEVDVGGLTVRAGELRVAATMPASAHQALVTGLWDGTGLLLADFDQVRSLADTLPYVT